MRNKSPWFKALVVTIVALILVGFKFATLCAQAPCAFVEINVKHNGDPVEGTCVILTCLDCDPQVSKTVYTDEWGDAFFDMQLWPIDCHPCCPATDNVGDYRYRVHEWGYSKDFYYDGTIYEDFKNFTTNPTGICAQPK
jgi:hypothetical protein